MNKDTFAPTELSHLEPVAWVTLGLVVYINGPLRDVRDECVAVLDRLFSSSIFSGLAWSRFSNEMHWRSFDRHGLMKQIQSELSSRPYWRMEVANRKEMPEVSISFQDAQATYHGHARASAMMIRLPIGTSPMELLRVSELINAEIPYWHGSAGYMFHPKESEWELAYDQIWSWSRRYWGIGVVDLRAGTWDAITGLLDTNWLTLLGNDFIAKKLPNNHRAHVPSQLSCHVSKHGMILQAGALPTLGDQNLFADMTSYRDAARWLEPALIKEATSFRGMFFDHDSTLLWVRRLLEPHKWQETA